jgi:RNA polymerase sigma-70 factor (ECF subfamily)
MEAFPPPPDERASLDLVKRLSAGEDEAWRELYRRHRDRMLFAIRMRMGRELRAFVQSEDILQSVARDAWRGLREFQYRGPGSLERYLWVLIANKLRDRADSARVPGRSGHQPFDTLLSETVAAPGTEPGYSDPVAYERLERALAGLPEDLREILLLRKVDGYSSQAVASRLGKSDDGVRKATSRALAILATRMADLGSTS